MNVSCFYINVRIFNWAETSNYFYFFHDKNLLSLNSALAGACKDSIGETKGEIKNRRDDGSANDNQTGFSLRSTGGQFGTFGFRDLAGQKETR